MSLSRFAFSEIILNAIYFYLTRGCDWSFDKCYLLRAHQRSLSYGNPPLRRERWGVGMVGGVYLLLCLKDYDFSVDVNNECLCGILLAR